jgi:hypothetical protein
MLAGRRGRSRRTGALRVRRSRQIGMTRLLDPFGPGPRARRRVRAAPISRNALIFSEDAVALETSLHQRPGAKGRPGQHAEREFLTSPPPRCDKVLLARAARHVDGEAMARTCHGQQSVFSKRLPSAGCGRTGTCPDVADQPRLPKSERPLVRSASDRPFVDAIGSASQHPRG